VLAWLLYGPARRPVVTEDTLPDVVNRCEYAVRGELFKAAQARAAQGKEVRV
jgi:hypothetical protein